MDIDTCHFEIHAHSMEASEAFYVGALGLKVLQRLPQAKLIALQAGAVRISIFYDSTIEAIRGASSAGARVIFRTSSLAEVIHRFGALGIHTSTISEAPGFMRFISLEDPSGNKVEIAEYLRDPLIAL